MKKMTLVLSLLLFGAFSLPLTAQTSIKTLMKKCESMESVEVTFITKKDPKTGKLQSILTTVKITNNANLVNEFLQAFEKEREKAYVAQGSIKNGVSIPSNYEFYDGKEFYTSCRISLSKDKSGATITYGESPNRPIHTHYSSGAFAVMEGSSVSFVGFDSIELSTESVRARTIEVDSLRRGIIKTGNATEN